MKKKPMTVAEAGRLGGSKTSAAKTRAVRKNAKKGGRPRKVEAAADGGTARTATEHE